MSNTQSSVYKFTILGNKNEILRELNWEHYLVHSAS
jgi:hypothetical protein